MQSCWAYSRLATAGLMDLGVPPPGEEDEAQDSDGYAGAGVGGAVIGACACGC